ncbi:hypothetical protein BB559_003288 [Furculomyces boomerangus]|uniref:Phosphoinositide phospholipase C n=1 Tax=Furculomyces boomerangus TaxID=61424 RepID=A0A2T9YM39_9FUNG|nr:hypothetical protein BB559_003288 [Furculomyces boomerangus]
MTSTNSQETIHFYPLYNTSKVISNIGICTLPKDQVISDHKQKIRKIAEISSKKYLILKATSRKLHYKPFRLDFQQQRIVWESKKNRFNNKVDLERIYEIRFGQSAEETIKIPSNISEKLKENIIVISYIRKSEHKTLEIFTQDKQDFTEWIFFLQVVLNSLTQIQSTEDQKIWDSVIAARQNWEYDITRKDNYFYTESQKDIPNVLDQNSRPTIPLALPNKSKRIIGNFPRWGIFESGRQQSVSFYEKISGLNREINEHSLYKKNNFTYILNECYKENLVTFGKKHEFQYKDFKNFVLNIQKDKISDAQIKKIFYSYSNSSGIITKKCLLNYLKSSHNSITFEPPPKTALIDLNEHNTHYQQINMDKPMNEYFISSSHNTYLLGGQIIGTSSIEGYIRALHKGCRCLEIDCWDGPLGEPVVCHGRTFTTRIPFKDVIEIIKSYAFIRTPYPVILSLEMRCSMPQQVKVANILKEVLGSALVTTRIKSKTAIPSPNDLMFRFLVKNKIILGNSRNSSSNNVFKQQQTHKCYNSSKVAKELSDLAIYFQAMHFEDITDNYTKNGAIVSVSESTAVQIKNSNPNFLYEKSCLNFIRIYPSFSRINSTNFNPVPFWDSGVQMVALNYQTFDKNMQIHDAFFGMSYGTGYVLKPPHLRNLESENNIDIDREHSLRSVNESTCNLESDGVFASVDTKTNNDGNFLKHQEIIPKTECKNQFAEPRKLIVKFLNASVGKEVKSTEMKSGISCQIELIYDMQKGPFAMIGTYDFGNDMKKTNTFLTSNGNSDRYDSFSSGGKASEKEYPDTDFKNHKNYFIGNFDFEESKSLSKKSSKNWEVQTNKEEIKENLEYLQQKKVQNPRKIGFSVPFAKSCKGFFGSEIFSSPKKKSVSVKSLKTNLSNASTSISTTTTIIGQANNTTYQTEYTQLASMSEGFWKDTGCIALIPRTKIIICRFSIRALGKGGVGETEIASACIPIEMLKVGYRQIELQPNWSSGAFIGESLYPFMFVRIE